MNKDIYIRAIRIETGQEAVPAHLLRELRRADDFIRLAVLAGTAVLEGAEVGGGSSEIGVFLGTTTGPLETNFRFLDTLFDNGEGQASPTMFSHSVHNAAVGYVARLLNIQGPAFTITAPGWPFLAALAEARAALENLDLQAVLALAVEEESPLLVEARERQRAGEPAGNPPASPRRLGAVAWLLTTARGPGLVAPRLRELALEEKPCDAVFYLQRQQECFLPARESSGREQGPLGLAAALSLSRAVQEAGRRREQSLSWTATAPCGRASVLIEF
jgi:hypothetical protein